MIYITGDTHGETSSFQQILDFCIAYKTTKEDFMIITGDAGLNYNLNRLDMELKEWVSDFPITFFFVRGNHEERPENLPEYELIKIDNERIEGNVFVEEMYPSLLFADNGLFRIENMSFYVINGAYSVDKYSRLAFNAPWFSDEELFESEMEKIKAEIKNIPYVDFVLTHTCPEKYIPEDALLPNFNQKYISRKMEKFLDEIESSLNYGLWYCGHWHIDKVEERIVFLYNEILNVEH